MKKVRTKLAVSVVAGLCFALANGVQAQQRDHSKDQQRDISKQVEKGKYRDHSTIGKPTRINKASGLIGMAVKNQQNEKLGDIKDIVIDLEGERVSYAVLGIGGALGMGDKMVAVPLSAFTPGADQKHLVLNATRESLQQAKGFDRNNWPSVSNPDWGAKPFWQEPMQHHELRQGAATELRSETYTRDRELRREYRDFDTDDEARVVRPRDSTSLIPSKQQRQFQEMGAMEQVVPPHERDYDYQTKEYRSRDYTSRRDISRQHDQTLRGELDTETYAGVETDIQTGQPTAINKATGLMGMDVRNHQDQKLGSIKDVVIDLENEQVSYAVLGVGGFLGMGEKLIAVPLEAFSPGVDDNYLILSADKASVQRAEGFGQNWPSVTNPEWGAQPFWEEKGSQLEQQDLQHEQRHEKHFRQDTERKDFEQRSDFRGQAQADQPARINKATSLLGMDVKNQQDEKLGNIKDVVIDLESDRISYAVLSVGGFLGLGEKLLAVPLSALTASPDQNYLILNADKESIQRAEGIGQNWPNVQNPEWGAETFWEEGEEVERELKDLQRDTEREFEEMQEDVESEFEDID